MPPPPILFPFVKSKPKCRRSFDSFDSLETSALPHPDEKFSFVKSKPKCRRSFDSFDSLETPAPSHPDEKFPFVKSKPKFRSSFDSFDSLETPALPHPDEKAFVKSKPKGRSFESFDSLETPARPHPDEKNIVKHPAFSTKSTMNSDAVSFPFQSDSESDLSDVLLPMVPKGQSGSPKPGLSNTITGTKKSMASSKWGSGWGFGKKNKEKGGETEINEKSASQVDLPLYQPVVLEDSKSTQASHSTQRSHDTQRPQNSRHTQNTQNTHCTHESHRTHVSQQSKLSQGSKKTYSNSSRSTAPKRRPPLVNDHVLYSQNSTDVGLEFERKVNEQNSIRVKPHTTERLQDMRRLMIKDKLDY